MEKRLKILEEDLMATRDELKRLLVDMRGFLLSAQNPLSIEPRQTAHDSDKENW